MKKLRRYLQDIWRVFIFAWSLVPGYGSAYLVVSLLLALLPLGYDAALGYLINQLTLGNLSILAITLFILALALPQLLNPLQLFFNKQMRFYREQALAINYTAKIAGLDQARLEDPDFKDLEERGTRYGEQYPFNRTFYIVSSSAGAVLGVILAAAALLAVNPVYFGLAIVAVLPEIWIRFKYTNNTWGINNAEKRDRRLLKDRKYLLLERKSLLEMQLFGSVQYIIDRMQEIFDIFVINQIKVERKNLFLSLLAQGWNLLFIIILIIIIVRSVVTGEVEPGTLVFILGAVSKVGGGLSRLFTEVADLSEVTRYGNDILDIYDTEAVVKDPVASVPVPEDITIKFDNVTFSYPHDKTKEPILKNLNLTICPGDKIALIGLNGAGKSTLIKLLCRFYDPTEGKITVGGVDIKNFKRSEWYEKLSVLFQDFTTLKFRVDEAIGFSATTQQKSPDVDRVIQSAVQSRADEFVRKLKDEYQTQVGVEFEGAEFSKGQSQKLALARAFYRDPKILILDEPTAAVDAAAEAETFANLEDWAGDKTLILISHRFSTVRSVDRIIILRDGQITEDGSHKELLAKGGEYARLFHKQAEGYQ